MSVIAMCCQVSSTKMRTYCNKLSRRRWSKLTTLATVDVRPTSLAMFGHTERPPLYRTMRKRQLVVRVHMRQLILVVLLLNKLLLNKLRLPDGEFIIASITGWSIYWLSLGFTSHSWLSRRVIIFEETTLARHWLSTTESQVVCIVRLPTS